MWGKVGEGGGGGVGCAFVGKLRPRGEEVLYFKVHSSTRVPI